MVNADITLVTNGGLVSYEAAARGALDSGDSIRTNPDGANLQPLSINLAVAAMLQEMRSPRKGFENRMKAPAGPLSRPLQP